ncbi:hepatic sodium/bile acid cotransporter [Lethenteron reissneri]|uniref:hepatic sodium/bile acid cotransporter n=1 Tax=Lethenteron reissneri TaxID=7753 RepID=UPI002AB7CC9F|nr:hepatic sodium/bile acid cotransporter [Lethenteron reissneri]
MALNFSWESSPPFGLNGSAGNATGGDGAILDEAVNAVTTAILVVTMVSLGCTMELQHIGAHIRKPRGIIIAVLAQFGIMPLTAFALAKVFRLNPVEAVTVLICGCCPGGNLSNVFALALDGDMNLSILMTTCSTVLALGMMPLLLWAYSHGLSDTRFVIPYAKISIALALILLPCAVGIFINAKFPKYSRVILRGGMLLLLLISVVLVVLSALYVGSAIWLVFSPTLISIAVLMPLLGYALGYVLAGIFRLSHKCRRTVSMETGCQNLQLCTAVLKLTFDPQVIGPLYLFPLLYIFFQVVTALLFVLVFRFYVHCYRQQRQPQTESVNAIYTGKAELEDMDVESTARDGAPAGHSSETVSWKRKLSWWKVKKQEER